MRKPAQGARHGAIPGRWQAALSPTPWRHAAGARARARSQRSSHGAARRRAKIDRASSIIAGAPRSDVGGDADQGSAVVDPTDPPRPPTPPAPPPPAPTTTRTVAPSGAAPVPAPPPAEPAAIPPPSAAVMRLRAPRRSVFGRAGSPARCRIRSGRIRSCAVRIVARGRVVAKGRSESQDAGSSSVTVTLELTGYGQTLFECHLGGVRTIMRARAATTGGARRAAGSTRAILGRERFTTPAGAWIPERAILTARGRSFVRSLRGNLIAVDRTLRRARRERSWDQGHRLAAQHLPRHGAVRRTRGARWPRATDTCRPRRLRADRLERNRGRPRQEPPRRGHHHAPVRRPLARAHFANRKPAVCSDPSAS